jgi:hypothetical protein
MLGAQGLQVGHGNVCVKLRLYNLKSHYSLLFNYVCVCMCGHVCVFLCMWFAYVCVCVCVCYVCACVCVCVCVYAYALLCARMRATPFVHLSARMSGTS